MLSSSSSSSSTSVSSDLKGPGSLSPQEFCEMLNGLFLLRDTGSPHNDKEMAIPDIRVEGEHYVICIDNEYRKGLARGKVAKLKEDYHLSGTPYGGLGRHSISVTREEAETIYKALCRSTVFCQRFSNYVQRIGELSLHMWGIGGESNLRMNLQREHYADSPEQLRKLKVHCRLINEIQDRSIIVTAEEAIRIKRMSQSELEKIVFEPMKPSELKAPSSSSPSTLSSSSTSSSSSASIPSTEQKISSISSSSSSSSSSRDTLFATPSLSSKIIKIREAIEPRIRFVKAFSQGTGYECRVVASADEKGYLISIRDTETKNCSSACIEAFNKLKTIFNLKNSVVRGADQGTLEISAEEAIQILAKPKPPAPTPDIMPWMSMMM